MPLPFNTAPIFSQSKPTVAHAVKNSLHTYVHACVINDQPTIVYPRGLEAESPDLLAQLSQYFSDRGYRLKEDQRHKDKSHHKEFKRRAWAPILLFTAGLFFESSAYADIEIDIAEANALNQQNVELKLVSSDSILKKIRNDLDVSPIFDKIEMPSLKTQTAKVLFNILISRYQKNDNDPGHVNEDLRQIADYYSNYPEVVSLFKALKDTNWSLVFDEHNWTTVASGNVLNIEQAEIHFNTRSAAQLRLNDSCKQNPVCIASPADALLHELLHVNSMFNDTETFMAQGGMNSMLYPYQHERSIIKQERELYKTMSQHDSIKRPSRHSHAGRIVKANCSICIK